MPSTSLTLNHEQLESLASGDRKLLERVLRDLFPVVHRWLHRTLTDKNVVEDALQETMIELARSLPRFRGDAKLSTFAHRITMRVAYRYFNRSKQARAELLEEGTQPSPQKLEAQILARSDLTLLHRLLDQLSEGRKAAFLLCEVEGLTPAEAGKLVGVPGLVMRSRLFRARADVKRLFADQSGRMPTALEVA